MCQLTTTEFLLSMSLHPVHTVCAMAFILVTTYIASIQLSKMKLNTFWHYTKKFLPALWQHNHCQFYILITYKYRTNIYCSQHHSSKCEVLFSRQVPAFYRDILLSSSGQNGMFLENMLPICQNRWYVITKHNNLH